ncbi:CotH kinase family protein [Paenibacillus puldeungensis]|uniref:CotH kinase family protein n=1 Tax=Paenibacillus puldeungensis TaxID=696536 RepID=A0ABW3RQF8_9BACL
MKRLRSRLLLGFCAVLLLFDLVACDAFNLAATDTDSKVTSQNKTGNTANVSQNSLTKSAVSAEEQKLDKEVFPEDKVIDVKITLDPDDFQDMLDNASAEQFKTATVDYNGKHFDNIGIRTKGNLSLRSVVQMSDSDRYSFKLSFDEYVDQTLDGIQKINLNNGYSDASYMREFLAYELSESMGLPTPKHSFVNVYINGKLWGFYLAVEQIGTSYLERNFDNAYGALYKGEMSGNGSDLTWLGDDPDAYTGLSLKSETTNHNILIKMLNELNNGTNYEKYINVQESLGYIALNVLTNNMDSYIGGNKQNYYLYEDEGIFSILPWDYNMAFGGLGGGMGRRGFGADGAAAQDDAAAPDGTVGDGAAKNGGSQMPPTPPTDQSQTQGKDAGTNQARTSLLIDEPTQGALAERPLVAKLLAVEEYKTEYHQILQQAAQGFLADQNFSKRVQQLSKLISPYVKADPRSFYSYEEYEQGVSQLITTNASQIKSIQQQLDGTIASAGDGSGSGGGMGGGMGRGMQQMGDRNSGGGQADNQGKPEGQKGQGFPGDRQGNLAQGNPPGDPPQGTQADGFRGQGGFRGGGPMGGGDPGQFGQAGQVSKSSTGSQDDVIIYSLSLILLVLVGVFITFAKRKPPQ